MYIYIYRLLDDVNCSNEFDSHSPLGARFDTINRTCSFFRKSARRIETNYRTCVSQLFPRKISFCDRINSYLSNKSIHDQRVSSVRSISLRGIRRSKTGAGRIALSQHRFKFNRREKTACTRN